MNILAIIPMPPPINGQTKASKVVVDRMIHEGYNVKIINFIKKEAKNGLSSASRVFVVLNILKQIWNNRKGNDLIYLSLSESTAGNIKDLFTYLILYSSNSRIIVHMLGGAGMTQILDKDNFLSKINYYFLNRINKIIVEGDKNYQMFSKYVNKEKVFIIPNFADDFLFANKDNIIKKFKTNCPLRLLYLSNLLPGKGYYELAKAFLALDTKYQSQYELSFVGGFESLASEKEFLSLIKGNTHIKYLGKFIDGESKKTLYGKTHLFALPTYYPYEGQPISILEAYASGIVVITTYHSEIPFIFKDKENGYVVEKQSVESLRATLEYIADNKQNLLSIALHNNDNAYKKYRVTNFENNIIKIITDAN